MSAKRDFKLIEMVELCRYIAKHPKAHVESSIEALTCELFICSKFQSSRVEV